MKDILERSNLQLSSGWRALLWLFVAAGVLAFIVGLVLGEPERTWQTVLINTVFWGGLAQAGVMLAVIWQLTDAKWGRPFKRLAEGFGAFLPVAFVLFVAVLFGAHYLYEWVEHPIPAKAAYLNLGFFSTRNIIALLVMYGISYAFVMASVKPDLAAARKLIPGWGGAFAARVLRNYPEERHEEEVVRLEGRSRRLAPLLGVVYAAVATMMAFDYLMSLDQVFFSTLFGVFFFMGNLYSALALMLVIAFFARRKPLLDEYMTRNRMHDLAKLTFAIALAWSYMVFSQYVVIWYSNLPEDAPYLVLRSMPGTPWYYVFWTLFFVLFLFPFLALMPRTVCRTPALTAGIGLVLAAGQWWVHYLLVVPSVQQYHHADFHVAFGWSEVLITLGFVGAFFLCFFAFLSRVPVLPISDKHLYKTWHGH